MDGVPLHQLARDRTYDVSESLGDFLVAIKAAEEAFSPKLPAVMDEAGGFPSSLLGGGVTVSNRRVTQTKKR